MQMYFAEIHSFSGLFDKQILNFLWKPIFEKKVTIIRDT